MLSPVAHLSRLLPLISCANLAIAVPSSTDHFDTALPHAKASLQDLTAPSHVFSRIQTHFVDWFWDVFGPVASEDAITAAPVENGQLRQTLAQYGDQVVLRFNVSTGEDAASLSEASEILFLDVWASGTDWVDMRVSRDVLPALLGLLPASLQHSHRALMQGNQLVQAIINTYPSSFSGSNFDASPSRRSSVSHATNKRSRGIINFNAFFEDYQSLNAIHHWMQLLQSMFTSHVRYISVGKTFEGRDIGALRVGARSDNAQHPSGPRKTIIIAGGQHAREWISVSSVTYIAYSLITKYGRDVGVTGLLDELDVILVPTLNPDGYQYSFDYDRLWRKNRQPTALQFCPGVDLDRCWNYKWDGQRTIDNPCSESFAGSSPFASEETRTFSEWAKTEAEKHNAHFIGFLDLHSYSQEILYPYSFSCGESPPTLEDLAEMAQGLAKAIRENDRENYKVMSACEGNVGLDGTISARIGGGGGGSALDWFYHEMGVRKSFQIKLRDKGAYGFLLPKEYIVPTGSELLSAVEWFAKDLAHSHAAERVSFAADSDL